MTKKSRVHLRARTVVHSELEGDDDVVLHPADLAAERDALFAEAVDGLFVLERVDLHLLLHAAPRRERVLAQQGVAEGDALVAKHVVEKCHHAVLDLLGCEDAKTPSAVVDAEPRKRKAIERALVVICLKAQIALNHNNDLAVAQLWHLADAVNVFLHEGKLLFRLCDKKHIISAKWQRIEMATIITTCACTRPSTHNAQDKKTTCLQRKA